MIQKNQNYKNNIIGQFVFKLSKQSTIMINQDQMYRMLLTKYAPKLGKAKKQPTYVLQEKVIEQQLPLEQAITVKSDPSIMKDTYDPLSVQRYWDAWWNHNKFFHADNQSSKPKFVICLPPPNVTGYLHIGHALTVAIEDSLARWKRMSGFETLYIPGTDHAGIATQTVVQKKIMKETGQTRHDLGRQAFVKKIWQWKEQYGNGILNQLRRVGASLDWERTVFTMDEQLCKSVTEAFVRLFEKKLIYRANRLVNWSTILKTAISDIEVDYEDIEGRTLITVPGYEKKVQFGVIVYFAYKLKQDPNKQIVVATTRIETMLGDVAVAVHPDDPRYKELIGKQLIHPFIENRKMIIISDTFVQKQFGSGAVKITPAHDPNDYQCGQRHNLQFINIFTDEGEINENGGKFKGMKRFQCRRIIQQELKKLNLFKQKKDNKMRLAKCSRSDDVIEPIIRPQWYVSCEEISKKMVDIVKNKEFKIHPVQQQETWFRWVGNLRDWCISRQLWWGHRIPAYLAYKKGTQKPSSFETNSYIVARNIQQAYEKASIRLQVPKEEIQLDQDQDVLDTWFSSGIFPFSPLKWPDVEHPDYKAFFPNTILETGHDILFFWVARMVMMSLLLTGELPFKETVLHPMVCDSEGQKMSKTRGNVIDPLEIIEGTTLDNLIAKIRNSNLNKGEQEKSVAKLRHEFPQGISQCGSDSLRFGLLAYMIQSRSINLNINVIINYRKFCNKIWNTFKFIYPKFQFIKQFGTSILNPCDENFLNSWILAKLNRAIIVVNKSFNTYTLGQAAKAFHNFWLYELCDVYLEATKPVFASGSSLEKEKAALTLFLCLETGMRLLHPMMPFISEQLYQKLPNFKGKAKSITIAKYPEPMQGVEEHFLKTQQNFQILAKFAGCLRSMASSVNLPPSIKPQAYIITNQKIAIEHTALIATLGKCCLVKIVEDEKQIPKGCGYSNIGANKLYINLGQHIDIQVQITRQIKKQEEKQAKIDSLNKKINDKNRDKVPEQLKKKQEAQLQEHIAELAIIVEAISKLKNIQ